MPFSTYIAEKLANFDKRTRMIAKKRINDIIFELEMGDHSSQSSLHHVSNSMHGWSRDIHGNAANPCSPVSWFQLTEIFLICKGQCH